MSFGGIYLTAMATIYDVISNQVTGSRDLPSYNSPGCNLLNIKKNQFDYVNPTNLKGTKLASCPSHSMPGKPGLVQPIPLFSYLCVWVGMKRSYFTDLFHRYGEIHNEEVFTVFHGHPNDDGSVLEPVQNSKLVGFVWQRGMVQVWIFCWIPERVL